MKEEKALACRAERGSIFPEAEVAARRGAARQGAARGHLTKPRSATIAAAEMTGLWIAVIVETGCRRVGEEQEAKTELKSESRGVRRGVPSPRKALCVASVCT